MVVNLHAMASCSAELVKRDIGYQQQGFAAWQEVLRKDFPKLTVPLIYVTSFQSVISLQKAV